MFFIIFYFILPINVFLRGKLFGQPTFFWIIVHILVVLSMHTYVLIVWRLQLHYKTITNLFGDKGFLYHRIIFFSLFILRISSIIIVAYANRNSFGINILILWTIAFIITIPQLYLFYSIVRYFGFARASGADHFDPSYKDKPFVKKGIYRYTNNGMYIFGILVFWLPGLVHASTAALLLALFNHTYIWIHYFTLEKVDFKKNYSQEK